MKPVIKWERRPQNVIAEGGDLESGLWAVTADGGFWDSFDGVHWHRRGATLPKTSATN